MPLNVDYYEGREQSYLKHLFLQKYLENAAYKLFQGRSPVFNFVDGVDLNAGPRRWNKDADFLPPNRRSPGSDAFLGSNTGPWPSPS